MEKDKLFKKMKGNNWQVNFDIYKEAKYKTINLIKQKKQEFFQEKLKNNIANPNLLWKTLKDLGVSDKKSVTSFKIVLDKYGEISFDAKENSEIFKDLYSSLASSLVEKLPFRPNRFTCESLKQFYCNCASVFDLCTLPQKTVEKILEDIDIEKAAGFDNIQGRFLKDGGKPALSISL